MTHHNKMRAIALECVDILVSDLQIKNTRWDIKFKLDSIISKILKIFSCSFSEWSINECSKNGLKRPKDFSK